MEAIENNSAPTSLSDGSANGVAPHADSLDHNEVLKKLVDEQILWVRRHASGWQFGERGVIEAVINHLDQHIPESSRWAVEFGAGAGGLDTITIGSLIERKDWKSLLIDAEKRYIEPLRDRAPGGAVIVHARVEFDGENSIDKIMARSGCTADPAVMVVDVDSTDYHIVKNMKARPYVLCIETMDIHCPKNTIVPYVPPVEECGTYSCDNGFGAAKQANAAAVDLLMVEYGYKILVRTRVNSIYVRGDIAPLLHKTCLNLGCGDHKLPGHVNLDIKDGVDIRKLDYADNSVDEVYASHVLEHFGAEETHDVLKEWVRVLKPGGVIRIAVPDIRKATIELQKEDPIDGHANLQSVIYGSRTDKNDRHQIGFVRETLQAWMYGAGIGFISEFQSFTNDCSSSPYSLNLEGVKRWFPKVEKPKVCLILSQPRFTFTGHEKSLILLAQKLKFDVQEACGAFWDRDITIATQLGIQKYDPDFLVYSDYDSVFEADDVNTLLDAINSDPTMAAIGCVQMSRHNDEPLVFDKKVDYSTDISKVTFQHFGLTVIRREVFDELEQPWFWSIPGKDDTGRWDWLRWARSDADITFWRNIDMLGMKVCQHNKVCIGHITQCVKYPRDKGRGVQLIPIENYWKHGKPKDAVFNGSLYMPKAAEPKKDDK